MSTIVIENCAIATVDDARREIASGHLVIEDMRLVAVGEGPAPTEHTNNAIRRIDASGRLVDQPPVRAGVQLRATGA